MFIVYWNNHNTEEWYGKGADLKTALSDLIEASGYEPSLEECEVYSAVPIQNINVKTIVEYVNPATGLAVTEIM